MRQTLLVVLAASLLAGGASAEPRTFTGTLEVKIGTLPAIGQTTMGTAEFTNPTTFSIPGGTFSVATTVVITDPRVSGTIPSLRASAGNAAGTFTNGVGPMALTGSTTVCLFDMTCSVSLVVPFDRPPDGSIGIGGEITVPGFISITLSQLGPWTTGVATVVNPFAMDTPEDPMTITQMGSVSGNTVVLVTPIAIFTSLEGTFPFLPGFGRFAVTFDAPEPGSAALALGAIGALFGLQYCRRSLA